MGLETGTFISDLVATNPLGSDQKTTADDHLRLLKSTIKASFPNVNGAVNPTPTEFNYLVGVTSGIQTQFNSKGNIAGQTWTGTHTFPSTVSFGNVSDVEISYLDGVTSAIQAQFNAKGAITGQTWTGSHNFPTQSANNNSTLAATTAYADAAKSIGDWVLISTATASASASIDFTGLSSTYDMYMVEIINAIPVTDSQYLIVRTSSNNGVSYDAAASNYVGSYLNANTAGVTSVTLPSTSSFVISDALSNAREGYSGILYITKPSATARCSLRSVGQSTVATTFLISSQVVSGRRDSATAVNAVRLMIGTGNMASGKFNLYGRKK
jgi:hypothetical protein